LTEKATVLAKKWQKNKEKNLTNRQETVINSIRSKSCFGYVKSIQYFQLVQEEFK